LGETEERYVEMNVKLVGISPRDEFGMVLVKLSVNVRRAKAWDGGDIGIFVPASDSISEIHKAALESLRQYAQDILGYPGNDASKDDPDHVSPEDLPQITLPPPTDFK
jgi:hypothetical protein